MAETPSNKQLPIGFKAPAFNLFAPIDKTYQSLDALKGKSGTALIFMCNHCPYVVHILASLCKVAEEYENNGIQFIGINSNDVESYPADSPENMAALIRTYQLPFPYLFDAEQEVAKSYKAACTPDIYLFDANLALFYHGQFDESRPGNSIPVTGQDLKNACDALLAHEAPPQTQSPSVGCNIKWKNYS